RSAEPEPAQMRLDRPPPGAGENVDAGARRIERQRVGEPRPLGLDVVALRALGFEFPHKVVMAVGGCPGGALRIAPGMAGLVEQGRIVRPARLAIERGVSRA